MAFALQIPLKRDQWWEERAFNALCHSTHLYGRRLVLEWADSEVSLQTLRRKTAEHFHAGRTDGLWLAAAPLTSGAGSADMTGMASGWQRCRRPPARPPPPSAEPGQPGMRDLPSSGPDGGRLSHRSLASSTALLWQPFLQRCQRLQRKAGHPLPLLPPSTPPNSPSLFEWCFGNISKRFGNILHTLSPFPRERLSVRGSLLESPQRKLPALQAGSYEYVPELPANAAGDRQEGASTAAAASVKGCLATAGNAINSEPGRPGRVLLGQLGKNHPCAWHLPPCQSQSHGQAVGKNTNSAKVKAAAATVVAPAPLATPSGPRPAQENRDPPSRELRPIPIFAGLGGAGPGSASRVPRRAPGAEQERLFWKDPSGCCRGGIGGPEEPPKKKRSGVLDEILEQLEDSENDGEEQTLQL
ncbi:hypothetical protein J1605_015453 [Eschrichtius robustus]|uniref:Uncharacterized protein n=1 Tax=Eschrichtius robustus TaxID=9764 RepID=A0AB34GCX7_ESCRO|nr:hypothetical protein J1605_015453 [Eschrichtius robustus]